MPTSGNTLFRSCVIAFIVLLAGCAPHPATGHWVTTADTGTGFTRLEVTYEGRANLYAAGEKEAGRHCFWSGESARAVAITCKPAFNTEIEEHYHLNVQADGTAVLSQADKVLAHFSRQVR